MRVGVKFCGNCNPLMDAVELLRKVAEQLPQLSFVAWNDDGYDTLLVVNGCDKDCATRPPFAGPRVEITNATVDHWPVISTELPDAVVAVLKDLRRRHPS